MRLQTATLLLTFLLNFDRVLLIAFQGGEVLILLSGPSISFDKRNPEIKVDFHTETYKALRQQPGCVKLFSLSNSRKQTSSEIRSPFIKNM